MAPQATLRKSRGLCAVAALCMMGSTAAARPDEWNLGYGTDLDSSTEWARNVINAFGEQEGWKVAATSNTDATRLFSDMTTRLRDYYTKDTGKFKIEGKVLVSYVTGHGSKTDDGKDTWLGNATSRTKLSEFATQVAGSIPPCGVLVFAVDECATSAFWDEFIGAGGSSAKNPFKGINVIVAMPADDACQQSPVGKAMGRLFQTKQTAKSYAAELAKDSKLKVWSSLDSTHESYTVTTPAPGALALAALSVMVAARRRRG